MYLFLLFFFFRGYIGGSKPRPAMFVVAGGPATLAISSFRSLYDFISLAGSIFVEQKKLDPLKKILKLFSELGVDCWGRLGRYSHEQIMNSTLDVDFAIFESAAGFANGGSITGIKENNFNVDNILTSLAKHLARQYVQYINKIDCNNDLQWVILSGGIPRNIPAMSTLITAYVRKSCIIHCSEIDETLHGLSKIARHHAG